MYNLQIGYLRFIIIRNIPAYPEIIYIFTSLLKMLLFNSDSWRLLWIRWYQLPIYYFTFACHSGYGAKDYSSFLNLSTPLITSLSNSLFNILLLCLFPSAYWTNYWMSYFFQHSYTESWLRFGFRQFFRRYLKFHWNFWI